MKTPTHDLIEEHGGIMLMLEIMEHMSEKLTRGEAVDIKHLRKVIEFLRNFADTCHHGKEEGILFPELQKNPDNLQRINELLGEHMSSRDLIRGMTESLSKYDAGNADAIHIAVNMKSYIRLLTEHIKTENLHLFPLAEQQLSPSLQADIQTRFDTLEREVIGVGKHEEYHGWLNELKTAYSV